MLLLLACSPGLTLGTTAPARDVPSDTATEAHAVAGTVLINEAMADNQSTYMEGMDFPDWVELYNPGPGDVSWDALVLEDGVLEDGAGNRLEMGRGALAEGARQVFSGMELDADGDEILVEVDGVVTDRLSLGELPPDTAWARFPDGGAWDPTVRGTPGWTNGSHPPFTIDPSALIFDPATIQSVAITLPQASADSLSASPYTEVTGSLAFGAAFYPTVGLRLKGVYGSLRSLDQKAAFKVDLNQFTGDHLRGLETLTFNNMVQDPSYVHELLAYRLFREAGLPAPRTGWTKLAINGEDWGLYLWVETVDATLLSRWYANSEGRLYEGAYGVDFQTGEEPYFEYDEGPEEEDRSDLVAVTTILAGEATDAAYEVLQTQLDMTQILRVLAVEALTYHWDGYTTANNYRVYHDPVSNRFTMLPWGTDQTFSSASYEPYAGQGQILRFCLQNAACTADYDEALLAMADVMEATPLEAEMDATLIFISEEIANDPRGEFDAATHEAYVELTRSIIRASPERIRAAVVAHRGG